LASKPANAAVHLTAVRFLTFSLGDAGTVGGFRAPICLKSFLKIAALPVKARDQDHGLPSSCP
jgi:hypothetical protein